MKFREILKTHNNASAEGGQSDILGDAFLLLRNPVYRRIKNYATELGASFVETDVEYLLLPFQQLDRIIVSKQVPYVPHGRLLAKIEAKNPGVFDLERMPMPESYHLHEAAHVIAAECCAKIELQSAQDRILKSILCESFANTVDALACGYADSEIHRIFLKLNCYMQPTEEAYELISSVRKACGEEYTARLILLSYLHANFLRDEVPLELYEIGMKSKDCIALSAIGQELDLVFREQTTANYFRLAGIEGDSLELLNFDFVQLLNRKDFAEAVKALLAALRF